MIRSLKTWLAAIFLAAMACSCGNNGTERLWWKDLGTEGSQDYPVLWWE